MEKFRQIPMEILDLGPINPKLVTDLGEHDKKVKERAAKHAAQERVRLEELCMGEPIAKVSKSDLSAYSFVLHRMSGLPKEEARNRFRLVRMRCLRGDPKNPNLQPLALRAVKGAVEGLKKFNLIASEGNITKHIKPNGEGQITAPANIAGSEIVPPSEIYRETVVFASAK